MKKICVLFVTDTCIGANHAFTGGAESQLMWLVRGLNASIFKPVVAQLSFWKDLPISDGELDEVIVRTFPTRRIWGLGALRTAFHLGDLIKREGVDIVHTFFERSDILGSIVAKWFNVPVILSSRRDMGFKRGRINRYWSRIINPFFTKIIAVSHAVKANIVDKENVERNKVVTVYNGVDLNRYDRQVDKAEKMKELGVTYTDKVVGMIANFNFLIKGHRYFLEAAAKIVKDMPDVQFLLVGSGVLERSFKALAESLNLNCNVHFLGWRSDIPELLGIMNVSVLPSLSEGLPNVLLESMAAGRPVVATNVGGCPEVVVDGETGFLVPPADYEALAERLARILRNPELERKMGESGRLRVEKHFTIGTMTKKFEELYLALVKDNRCR